MTSELAKTYKFGFSAEVLELAPEDLLLKENVPKVVASADILALLWEDSYEERHIRALVNSWRERGSIDRKLILPVTLGSARTRGLPDFESIYRVSIVDPSQLDAACRQILEYVHEFSERNAALTFPGTYEDAGAR